MKSPSKSLVDTRENYEEQYALILLVTAERDEKLTAMWFFNFRYFILGGVRTQHLGGNLGVLLAGSSRKSPLQFNLKELRD